MTPEEEQRLFQPLSSAKVQRLRDIEEESRRKLIAKFGPGYAPRTRFRIKYSDLNRDDYLAAMNEIQEIHGIPDIIEGGVTPQLIKDQSSIGSQAFGRFNIDLAAYQQQHGKIDAHAIFLSQQNITYRGAPGPGQALGDMYHAAGTMYTQDALESIAAQHEAHFALPDRYTVFDVEAPGLDPDQGIWEVAGRSYQRMRGKIKEVPKSDFSYHFPNAFMNQGTYNTSLLGEHLADTTPFEWEKYGSKMKSFLEQLEKNQWNMVGHNIHYDYSMLITGMHKAPEYKTDLRFKQLVDRFEETFAKQSHKISDTRLLASFHLPGLELAPELRLRGMDTPHAIANILLQTDILESLRKDVGTQKVQEIVENLHRGDIDTLISAKIREYTAEGGIGIHPQRMANQAFRREILKGSAIGPHIPLTMEGLDEGLVNRALQNGLINVNFSLDPSAPITGTPRLTPMEQLAWQTSRPEGLPGLKGEFNEVEAPSLFRQLQSRLYTKEGLTRRASGYRAPTISEWGGFQKRLSEQGDPFAHLSLIERHLTAEMGKRSFSAKTRRFVGPEGHHEEQLASQMGDFFGLSTMMAPDRPRVFKSGILSLSREHLEEAIGPVHIGGLSPYEYTSKKSGRLKRDVAWNVSLKEDEGQRLAKYIARDDIQEQLLAEGASLGEIGKMYERLMSGQSDVVQIASLTRGAGGEDANKLFKLITELGGNLFDARDQRSPLGMVLPPRGELPATHPGTVMGGPVRFMAGYSKEDYEQYDVPAIHQAAERRASFMERFSPGRFLKRDERLAQRAIDSARKRNYVKEETEKVIGAASATEKITGKTAASEIAAHAEQLYNRFKKPTALGLGVIGLSAFGYYMHKKKAKNKLVDQTIAPQPLEESQSQGPAPDPYQDIMQGGESADPLRTAQVVRTLNKQRIGHHRMDPYRNSHLFNP